MSKLKKIFGSWQVWLLIITVSLSVVSLINFNATTEGVLIDTVASDTTASVNSISSGEIITHINGERIKSIEDYTSEIKSLNPGIFSITTNSQEYSLVYSENESIGITVKEIPPTNLKKGLDLEGGVRVLLEPEEEITSTNMDSAIDVIKNRLNAYGLSDINVKSTVIEDQEYILIEASGATREEIKELAVSQGKFEAKIGNETIFVGGKDIKDVCRSTDCSGISMQNGCGQTEEGWACQFQFRVDVSPESAEKHKEVTSQLEVIRVDNQEYLSEKLDLYLDGELTDSLYISKSLKGQASTSFVIQGPGYGETKEEAMYNALENMKKQQTVLITGSLPTKFKIDSMTSISPILGENFFSAAILTLIVAILAVSGVIYAKFRKIKIASLMILTMVCEATIILGVAAAINWNLDLAAIAAIIATIGTGVDSQIILTEETINSKSDTSWKARVKRALSIIFGAYFTTLMAMIVLFFLGPSMLKGFAVITIIGATMGVFVTRMAYGKLIEILND